MFNLFGGRESNYVRLNLPVKYATKNEIRLTNKDFIPKLDFE